MWTNKDAPSGTAPAAPSTLPASTSRTPAHLGPGVRIKGEITGNEDLRLDGKIEGSISLGGFRLTVGSTAHIQADIVAREVVVAGEVKGNVTARDRIEIRREGSIVGDLSTARIVIEEGSFFKGAIEIDTTRSQVGTDLDTLLGQAKHAEKK
jgi:cytoskeletal protein CcmA (bactofilin family)